MDKKQNQAQEDNPRQNLPPQEKTTIGGQFNSGVTSHDDAEREEIEKKGSMANINQRKEESQ